ncbi:helix-turn-helix transcriptional regulator [Actinoplanes sp. NPDC049316]|uniref:helix-turn-helix domain-containing protein n=1 Tax=Actinoplanes sp. NPDC049316 TaxID=3154727 RepID=UPI00342D97B2
MTGDNLFGEFLKARRSRVTPEEAGVRANGRRRVAGLRRAELAALAGVSEPYLVRLEQGRDRNPSPQVLAALGRALRLDADGLAHLRRLAAPEPAPATAEQLADGMQELLDAWSGVPAYVRGRHFDVLASNALAQALAPAHRPGRNLVRDVFLDPETRVRYADWPAVARSTVAALRAAIGADPDDPVLPALVEELCGSSASFRELWDRHDVRPTRDETKAFAHPVAGRLTLRRHVLHVDGTHGQVVIAYRPEPGSPAVAALASLVSAASDDA